MNDTQNDLLAMVDASGLGNLQFATPWSARLFGMTLAAVEKQLFSLNDFQQALIGAIDRHEHQGCIETEEQYYTCWLEALNALLETNTLIDGSRLAERESELAESARHRHDHQRHGNQIRPEAIG